MPALKGGALSHLGSASVNEPETTTLKLPTAPRGSKLASLSLAALGIVFGDIGTSPLYAMQTVFSIEHNEVKPTPVDVYGIISMILWSITLVVSFKYVILVMRADNDGEGGILALTHLLRDRVTNRRRLSLVIVVGMLGAALFYGDSVITPAISVMSAIEGLTVVNPSFEHLVLPLAVVILSALFVVQRWGTAAVGRAFGPVMILWFLVLGVLGVPHILAHPGILRAISPTYAIAFVVEHPMIAFVAMGAVVLTITGAEAVYADMGHFGPRPIKLSWFAVVFPALSLNYLGQAAMILEDPSTINNPFFNMAPGWATLPLVGLATVATVIASQAVISGAFSVSRQAVRLGLLPRLLVRQTSKEEGGQIFVPVINWILYLGVLALISIFGSSASLASACGLAVTGTLIRAQFRTAPDPGRRNIPAPEQHEHTAGAAHGGAVHARHVRERRAGPDHQRERAAHPARGSGRGARPGRPCGRHRSRGGARRLQRLPGHPQGSCPGCRQDARARVRRGARATSCPCSPCTGLVTRGCNRGASGSSCSWRTMRPRAPRSFTCRPTGLW